MSRAIHSVSDWTEGELDAILSRAGELANGSAPNPAPRALVGMCFFQPSLRTRVGFEAAAHRLGIGFVEALERRHSKESMPERIEDTIRVMSGYCNGLIVRSSLPSPELRAAALPQTTWLNGGDSLEHPSQALIDLFAIERFVGPIDEQRIAIVGDLRMRSVQSLLTLFGRYPSAGLIVVSAPELTVEQLPNGTTTVHDIADLVDLTPDVVYLAGIPHQIVPEAIRTRLRLDRRTLDRLPSASAILSPLPLIDEVASNARDDARVRWFDQSDLGLWVRVAVLEHLLR